MITRKSVVKSSLRVFGLATVSGLAMASGTVNAQDGGADEAENADRNVIIVTARKREETLLEVPLSISAVSQEDIADRGLQTAADLSAYTPGFDFQESGQGGASGRENPNIRFRGVAVQNESPSSRAGSVFYEGAYLSAGAGLIPLFDLQRVEVIKGPQNAFFGRNTFAGAVNFIAAEPGDEFEGFVNALYSPSDQDTYQLSGAVSVPLTENLAARVGAYYRRAGADITFGNGDPLGEEDTLAIQGALLFDNGTVRLKTSGYWVDASDTRALVSQDYTFGPGECDLVYSGKIRDVATGEIIGDFSTDLSNSTRGTFCGKIPDYDAPGGYGVSPIGSFKGVTVPLDAFSGSVDFNRRLPPEMEKYAMPKAPNGLGNTYYTWRVNQSADVEVFDGHKISALFSYGRAGNYRMADQYYGQNPAGQLRLAPLASYAEDLVGELRITSPDDKRLRYVFGFSHIDTKSRLAEYSAFAGFGGTFDDQPLTFSDLKSDALFGSVDFDITDQVTLSVEGRYAWDTLTTVYRGPTLRDYGPNDPLPAFTENEDQKLNKFMPRVLLSYNPNDTLNIYGSFALSYLLGNATNIVEYASYFPNAEDLGLTIENIGLFTPPQKMTAYEVGIKAQPLPNLNLAIAAYKMDWKNQITFDLTPNFRPLYTAGDSKYKGVEAEATFEPVDWLVLNGNVAYVDAKFTDFGGAGSVVTQVLYPTIQAGTQISSVGLTPRYISKWSGAFGVKFEFDDLLQLDREVFLRFDGTYIGDFWEDNFEYNKIKGYWKFNARLATQVTDSLRIDLYGLNLTDDQSFNSTGGTTTGAAFPNGMGGTFGTRKTYSTLPRARELGVELRFKF